MLRTLSFIEACCVSEGFRLRNCLKGLFGYRCESLFALRGRGLQWEIASFAMEECQKSVLHRVPVPLPLGPKLLHYSLIVSNWFS